MALKSKLASTDAATKAHLHKYQEGKEEVQDPQTINPLEKSVDRTMTEFLLLPMNIPDRNVAFTFWIGLGIQRSENPRIGNVEWE
ncbi:hypothetical protein WN944_000038 [Citrus x changshan-huyou]|uniref:Uncharacterized protein n=1 Tax=Citrus x changshan-huyou TaxID=2935761 RepID=A0AAP0MGG0_9ROSI